MLRYIDLRSFTIALMAVVVSALNARGHVFDPQPRQNKDVKSNASKLPCLTLRQKGAVLASSLPWWQHVVSGTRCQGYLM